MSQQEQVTMESAIDSSSKPYKILRNEKVGRYVVAKRDLKPGDELWSELPFVVGPKAFTHALCLGCYKPWPSILGDHQLCSRCGWPVCGPDCENVAHHKDYECQVFAESGQKFDLTAALEGDTSNGVPQLECITPLRLLLASEKNTHRWETEVKDMQAHNQKRSEKPQWKADYVNIVKYLRTRCKLNRFSEDDIHTACGILEINSHEVRTSSGYNARALYPLTSLMNHSCVSNTIHSIAPEDFRVRVRTTIEVPAGGELYGSYAHSLLPTIIRREHLYYAKYFECACPRCADPTELGTHMSSLKCNKCDNGIVLPLDSLDPESSWKCTRCEFSTSGQAIQRVFHILQTAVDEVDQITGADGEEAINARENIIKKYSSVLHPRNAFLTMMRYTLSQLYGRCEGYLLDDLPDVVLEHKVDICRLLLQVLDVIEPGYSRTRGMTMYELHAPLLFLAKNLWNAGVIDDAGLKSKMTEAAVILRESANILSLEPSESPEGQIGMAATQSLAELQASIDNL